MMAQTGVRFHGNLDPTAQEFRPARNPNPPFFDPLPLPSPPPPPVQQQQQLYYPPAYEVQVVPFQYHHQQHHAAPPPPTASVAPPLPPPSPTATRALALGPVPGDASESWVRRELEVFGDVRAVQMERARRDGVVTVHFYDLRHAKRALRAIREQHMQRQCHLRDHYGPLPAPAAEDPCCLGGAPAGLAAGAPALWAQFVIPAVHAIPEGQNQGTVVVFNLDPDVSAASLRELFDPFGPVKELRETPFKKHQRFVEFYDVRDAATALAQMNGKEIHGKNVVIEFSRPGGYNRKFLLDAASPTPFAHDSSYLYNSPAASYHAKIPKNSPPPPPPPPPPPLPLPCRVAAAAAPPGLRILQPNKPDKKQLSGLGEASPNVEKSSVVEASMNRLSLSGGDAHRSERVEGEYCNEGSVVTARKSAKKRQGNSIKQQQSQSCRSSSGSGSGRPWKSNKQGRHKLDSRFVISEEDDSTVAEASSGDSRTTVMIKNIPNKYSQKLLLNMLDNHCIHCNEQVGEDHCEDDDRQPLSAYDFVYLPIDFNNKCNVGYGFVNMTTPQAARRLYKAFHLRHWEVFNSRKICEVTYARIQGLEALKAHFRNSKFPSEAEHYLPVVFSPPREGRRLTEPLPAVGQQQQRQRREGDDENEMEGRDERAGIDGNDVCCSEEGDGGGGRCRGSGSQSSNGGDNGDDDGDREKN